MKKDFCPFCQLCSGLDHPEVDSKQSDIFFQDDYTLAFISAAWWPNNPASALVIPRKHFSNIYNITLDVYSRVNEVARNVALALKTELCCQGVSLRQHNEAAGGQSIGHYHHWVFPRYENDRLYELYAEGRQVSIDQRFAYAERLKKYFT